MKKMWKMRKNKEAVSPVIATILMVAITVVLAAVLYVMVMGFGGTGSTPTGALNAVRTGSGNYQVSVVSISQPNVQNSSVTIIVTPTGGVKGAWHGPSQFVGAGDYFTVTGLTVGTTYTISLKYNPTGNSIASTTVTAS